MNFRGTLEYGSASERLGLEASDDPEHRNSESAGAGQRRDSRSFRTAWHRRVPRRPPAGEPALPMHQLSPREERRLAERGRAGDVDAEQQLITANLKLVFRAVRDYRRCGVPLDDLIQEGNLGLIRAARQFDPATHTARFATYATYWIRCFIVRALASNGSLIQQPEHAQLLRLQYREAVDELRSRSEPPGGEPDSPSAAIDDVARYLGVPAHRLEESRLAAAEPAICQSLAELTIAIGPEPEETLVSNEERALVCAALRRLSPFEAWVICERFGLDEPLGRRSRQASSARDPGNERNRDPIHPGPSGAGSDRGTEPRETCSQRTYLEMGRDCGLTVFRLRQVERTALEKLRTILEQRMSDES